VRGAHLTTGLECVVNVSEGRDRCVLDRLTDACGTTFLDLHSDPDHHRSVFTMAGPARGVEEAVRAVTSVAVATLTIKAHSGQHPRFGVVDVVPFVPLAPPPVSGRPGASGVAGWPGRGPCLAVEPPLDQAIAARSRFARWAGSELDLPCFFYGPLPHGGHRTLPEVRRSAFSTLRPDSGPDRPHPRAGACAVGARHFLIAYNVWIAGGDLRLARSVAAAIRGPAVRALGLELAGRVQVSCNLIHPSTVGPSEVHDQIARLLGASGASVDACELVGLLPASVLAAIPPDRWSELDLRPESTIEARLEERGISWR